jgi:CRP/FNR family cyclic AMP-dependent transcriptional regulator
MALWRWLLLRNMVPLESLRRLEIFHGCDDKLLRRLSKLGTEVQARTRQVLAREGQPGREFYVIEDGSAEVMSGDTVLATLTAGDFFGEMSLVDGKPRSATVIACTPMTLYVFDPREFFSLVQDFPPVARRILAEMADRLRHAQAPSERTAG